jgi:hypothetical protein
MVLQHVTYFSPDENSAECQIIYHKKVAKCKESIIFWLPFKVLNHHNFTNCQKVTELVQFVEQWVLFY